MTTKITVSANHGWPVDVTSILRSDPENIQTTRVPAGQEQIFYIHSNLDLRIHEVQPSEDADAVEPAL